MDNDVNNAVDAAELEENDAWLIAEIEGNMGGSDGGAPAEEAENFSFEDSERFEDESLCSLPSENGSLNHKWRGWASRNVNSADQPGLSGVNTSANAASGSAGAAEAAVAKSFEDMSLGTSGSSKATMPKREIKIGSTLRRLEELASRQIAQSMSFEAIESLYDKLMSSRIPECLVLSILKRCFPESEKDIRLYSCLANTHSSQFSDGERLYYAGAVGEIFQIGYLVQARVSANAGSAPSDSSSHQHNVSIRVDKCRIVACECSCSALASWCQHVVAVCLKRLYQPATVQYRMTVWDSITSLGDIEVKKLAQYLINELPPEYLTTAQKIIDSLQTPQSEINRSMGAPDPTADCHGGVVASWYMNEKIIHENIYKILMNFVRPAPTVHCDIQYLSSSCPPASSEWSVLIRPLRAREPEALWNLLSIVREQLRRGDENAGALLHIITVDCLRLEPLVVWWYQTALAASGRWTSCGSGKPPPAGQQQAHAAQRNAAALCDEIVALWRLVALNPRLSADERDQLSTLLQSYHRAAVDLIWKRIESASSGLTDSRTFLHFALNVAETASGAPLNPQNASFAARLFPGFFAAIQACHLDWCDSDFGRTVRELGLNCLQTAIQCSTNSDPSPADRFRNIPLLLAGAEALAAELADGEHTVTTAAAVAVAAAGGTAATELSYELSKSARARQKQRRRAAQARRAQRNNNRNAQQAGHNNNNNANNYRHQPQQQREQLQQAVQAANNAAAAESSDSMVEDAEEEFEDGPSCSNQLSKSATKKTKLAAAKLPYEADLEMLFASSHGELENGFAARFTCCEALLGYGYGTEAFVLARRLAEELLDNPPNLLLDELTSQSENLTIMSKPAVSRPARRIVAVASDARIDASCRAVAALSRSLFLVRVLASGRPGCSVSSQRSANSLALELGMRTLRNPRGPAATKSLEVHIYHLEQEVLGLLRRLPANGSEERALVRRLAFDYLFALRGDGAPAARRIVVPPFSMALYVLDALGGQRRIGGLSTAEDDELALVVALETLGARCAVSETDHPMLCECIRRQRGDLAMTLLLRNRDSIERLAIILDRVLDSSVHQMYSSTTSNASYFFKKLNPNQCNRQSQGGGLVSDILANILHAGGAQQSQTTSMVKMARLASVSSGGDALSDDAAGSSSKRVSESSTESIGAVLMEPPSQIFSNLATEAHAHFMVELAKRLLTEAGGNQSHTMFISRGGGGSHAATGGAPNAAGNGVPHRNLHICSFLTGLYALGLNNLVSSTWPTRTYSTHVSWIQAQAMEIGRAALHIVRDTWEVHLTPTEVASLADKASQSADPTVVEEGAQLALAVLPRAYALTAIESQKALNQCKEQSAELLERACEAVERAAEKDGVYPEVLFKVAHHWYNLHIESEPKMSTWDSSQPAVTSSSSSATPSGRLPYLHSKQPQMLPSASSVNYLRQSSSSTSTFAGELPSSPQSTLAAKTQAMIDQIVQQHQLRGSSQQHQQQPQQIQIRQHQQQHFQQQSHGGFIPAHAQACAIHRPYGGKMHNLPYLPNALGAAACSCRPQEDSSLGGAAKLHVSHSAPNLQPALPHTFPPMMAPPPPPPPPAIGTGIPLPPPPPPPHQVNCSTTYGNWNAYAQVNPVCGQYGPPGTHPTHVTPTGVNMPPPPTITTHYGVNQPQYCGQPPTCSVPPPPICQYGGQPQPTYAGQPLPAFGNQSQPPYCIPSPMGKQLHQQPQNHLASQPKLQSHFAQQPHSHAHLISNQQPHSHLHTPVASSQQPHAQIMINGIMPPMPLPPQTIPQPKAPPAPKPALSRLLVNAHRVGMRAMDTMGQRHSDDTRSFSKYSRTPAFGDDIRWLFEEVSMELGDAYVHSFCEKASTCIASPFLVLQLIKESIKYFKLTMPAMPACLLNVHMPSSAAAVAASQTGGDPQLQAQPPTTGVGGAVMSVEQMNAIRSCAAQVRYLMIVQQMYPPSIADLGRHCVEMAYMAAFNKLNHGRFNEADIEDTVELMLRVRELFGLVPPSHCRSMFESYLKFVRKQKACKKEPIQRINGALHPAPVLHLGVMDEWESEGGIKSM